MWTETAQRCGTKMRLEPDRGTADFRGTTSHHRLFHPKVTQCKTHQIRKHHFQTALWFVFPCTRHHQHHHQWTRTTTRQDVKPKRTSGQNGNRGRHARGRVPQSRRHQHKAWKGGKGNSVESRSQTEQYNNANPVLQALERSSSHKRARLSDGSVGP